MREKILSYLVTLCLTLSLAAGAAITGFAQGQPEREMGPLTQMVICDSNGGTSVISVDSSGNRVDPDRHCDARPCSNCLSTVAYYLPPVLTHVSFTRNALRVRAVDQHVNLRSFTAFHTAARGPPVEV
ncbi:hypothetical protein [Pararhodobacter sp.]|uniref:hypothetical protein n=1 Tax=Pararhodobacter sp. TaxID=2127056 RepID=UPI002AFE3A72|nr:hypothetical protein [Pararhodobacter sp.]